ncbi:MAG: hemin uptake protein HemP [Sphingomonadaceae bacterium]
MSTPPLPARPSLALPITPTTPASAPPLRRLSSAELLQGAREVEIDHAGRRYRLRVTQLNKLILTA